jgi:hypothetical protein
VTPADDDVALQTFKESEYMVTEEARTPNVHSRQVQLQHQPRTLPCRNDGCAKVVISSSASACKGGAAASVLHGGVVCYVQSIGLASKHDARSSRDAAHHAVSSSTSAPSRALPASLELGSACFVPSQPPEVHLRMLPAAPCLQNEGAKTQENV